MSNGEEEMGDAIGVRPGWRDVYRAVGDSEERIKAAIIDAVKPLAETSRDHEARLRSVEQGDLKWVNHWMEIADATHVDQGRRIGEVESTVKNWTGREVGIFAAIGAQRSFLILLFAAVAAIGVIVDVLSRFAV